MFASTTRVGLIQALATEDGMLESAVIAVVVVAALWLARRLWQKQSVKPHLTQTANAIAQIDRYAISKSIAGDSLLADRTSIFSQALKDGAESVAADKLLYPSDALAQIDAYDRLINNPQGLLMFIGREKHAEAAVYVRSMQHVRDRLWSIARRG